MPQTTRPTSKNIYVFFSLELFNETRTLSNNIKFLFVLQSIRYENPSRLQFYIVFHNFLSFDLTMSILVKYMLIACQIPLWRQWI